MYLDTSVVAKLYFIEYSLFPLFTTDKVMISAAKELKIKIVC